MPRRKKARERLGRNRLDLAAKRCERTPAEHAQDFRVAMLAAPDRRAKLACDHIAPCDQLCERSLDSRGRKAPPLNDVGRDEWHVGARPSSDQRRERLAAGAQIRVRQTHRKRYPQRLAVPTGVFGRDPSRLTRDAHGDGAPLTLQGSEPIDREPARGRLLLVEIAQPDQQVVRLIRIAWKALWKQA